MIRFAVFLFCILAPATFAGPREDVLRVVPDDAGFCLLVTELRDTLDRVQRSPFAQHFAKSTLGRELLAQVKGNGLDVLDRHLRGAFQTSWAEFRDEIAGDAFALAFMPGPDGKAESDSGLFALRARDPKLLARLLTRLNDLQKESGELTSVEHREYRQVRYWVRHKKDGGDEFATTIGPLFVLTDRESALQAAIDRNAAAGPPHLVERFARLGVDRATCVWWFNPRAFDAALRHKAASAEGPDAAFLRTFVRHWAAIDDAALRLRIDRNVELSLIVASKGLNPSRPAVSSGALSAFPADALFVAGGRMSFDALVRSAGEFLSAEARAEFLSGLDRSIGAVLGRDAASALTSAVGPDWGICIAPPAAAEPLPTLTIALRMRNEGTPPAPRRALEGLDFAARLAVLAYNGQHKGRLEIRTERHGDDEVRVVDGDAALPSGFRPAFAWKRGYLVVASSPVAVRRFEPSDNDEFVRYDELLLARLTVRNVVDYLRPRRIALTELLAQAKVKSPDVATKIDGLLAALELFQFVELTQRAEPGRATLSLRVRPTEAFAASAEKNPTELPASRSNSGAGTEKRP